MSNALLSQDGIERTFAGAVLPRTGSAGQLLAQYSVRLGSALMRHRAELAERASRVEAELASKVRSEFIANISHELRTPLNSIIGFSKILKTPGGAPLDPSQIAEYSNFIFDSAENLLSVVNDIIAISKLQSGKYDLNLEAIEPEELIRTCVHWANTAIAGTPLNLVSSIDPDLPSVRVDAEQLKNVVIRLVQNAMTFTPAGGRIALIARAGPEDCLMISVSDTGAGMTAQEVEEALIQFGQNDHSLDRNNGGTGLGLTITKAIIELHGGRLHIKSTKGEGTDAVIILPSADRQLSPGFAWG